MRAGGIIIHNNNILLMHRIKNGVEFYTIPGGFVEDGETPEHAAIREIEEETTIIASCGPLLYSIHDNWGVEQHYFLCTYISGTPTLGDCAEKNTMKETNQKNYYNPMWIPCKDIHSLTIFPEQLGVHLKADIGSLSQK